MKILIYSLYQQEVVTEVIGPFNPFEGKTIEQLYIEQKTWLINYINSPIYKSNLKKEFNLRKLNDKSLSAKEAASIDENMDLYIKQTIEKRINRITNGKVKFKKRLLHGTAGGDHGGKKVRISVKSISLNQYLVPIHELTHLSTNSEYSMIGETYNRLQSSTKIKNSYYKNPTEIHARITSIKYLAHALGFYDAFTQDFTVDVLNKLRSSELAKKDVNFKDLIEGIYPGQEEILIEMSNLVADITNPLEGNVFSAQI